MICDVSRESRLFINVKLPMLHLPTKFYALSTAFAFALASVAFAADEPQDSGIAYFEKHIRPLFAQHCYQCHSQRAKEVEGRLLLDSRAGWMEGGESGVSVVPGDVEASLLVKAVRYKDSNLEMPPVKPLSPVGVARIETWVRMGAHGPKEVDIRASVEPSDPIAGKVHWAFKSLGSPPLPNPKSNEWVDNSIDRFILQRLETNNLRPAKQAEPRDILRRLYFRLSGLPPSSQEVQAFLEDNEPDAIERVVDHLLASPRFGERWGRHWLDLARYADSNGLDENFLFREAWRYRNWVISRLNEDMPLDRFLLEQIAGDLLAYDSIDQRDQQRIAAGFLVMGPKVLLGNNEKRQRMEVADEQLDTIGKAILGQTLGCARCHDHKFDPIPTADYYAVAGIFASTNVMEERYMLGSQRVMERLVGLGQNGSKVDDSYEEYWRELPELKKKKKQAEAALKALEKNPCEELAELLSENADGLAELAADTKKTIEERIAAQASLVKEISTALDDPPKIPPRAMTPIEVDEPADEHIRLAGEFDRLGDIVPRGGLRVLLDDKPITIPARESGRVSFGRWLTEEDSRTSHLVARVQANRIWHHLMGVGLVRTVDNFGRTGEQPSHPELLDYLAQSLIDSDWSVKALVRQIALSRTFALSSEFDKANHAIDPDNRLLWRAHRRRLDPESFRDAMLTSAGQLDGTPMESSVGYLGDQATAVGANKVRRRTDFPCRSIYLPVIRNDLPELFQVFDFADPQTTTGARPNTTVPTQGLFLLNDSSVMDASNATASRIIAESPASDLDSRIDRMFDLILNTNATQEQRASMRGFIIQTADKLISEDDSEPELHSLAIACHAMFASSRFQFLE